VFGKVTEELKKCQNARRIEWINEIDDDLKNSDRIFMKRRMTVRYFINQ